MYERQQSEGRSNICCSRGLFAVKSTIQLYHHTQTSHNAQQMKKRTCSQNVMQKTAKKQKKIYYKIKPILPIKVLRLMYRILIRFRSIPLTACVRKHAHEQVYGDL